MIGLAIDLLLRALLPDPAAVGARLDCFARGSGNALAHIAYY